MVLFSKKIVLLGFWLLCAGTGFGQTLNLTLQEADSLFLARNIDLLAERYNISMADAAIAQAKLYHNPVISLEENVYNRLNHRAFDFGRKSEQVVNVDQLISIAGQHSNVVKEARSKHDVAVARFEELLRNLRAELHKAFVRLSFAQRNMKIYQHEIVSLRTTLDQLTVQEKKGNISQIETARIQALLLSVRREQNEFLEKVSDLQERLRLLMALPATTYITAEFHPNPSALPLAIRMQQRRHITIKRVIAIRPATGFLSVDIHLRLTHGAIKNQRGLPTGIHRKSGAIPPNSGIRQASGTSRFQTGFRLQVLCYRHLL